MTVTTPPLLIPPVDGLSDGTVTLRPWRDGDVDQIWLACQDPTLHQFIAVPSPYHLEDAADYVERTRRQWRDGAKAAFAVVDAVAGTSLLGAATLAVSGATGNAAYWVAPGCRHRGVGTRALRLLTDWAFASLGLGVIILEISPANLGSRRVAEACGYHEVGHFVVNPPFGPSDHLIYSRLAQ